MIAVPSDSTYQAGSAVPARPLGGPADEMPPPEARDDTARPRPGPAIPPPRLRAGHTFGSFALFCTGLGVALFLVAAIGSARLMLPKLSTMPTSNPTSMMPDPNMMKDIVAQNPWIEALQWGSVILGLAGLSLGIVSLTQAGANWRGLTAVIVSGLFLLCICGAVVMAVTLGFGAPAGG
jgi:hypothetical protein